MSKKYYTNDIFIMKTVKTEDSKSVTNNSKNVTIYSIGA